MNVRHVLGLDIGSNSVGSAWVDLSTGKIDIGLSVFPAGVDETDDKRGEPKNAKRRMTRRTRITLARRSLRKRELRLELIKRGLLPVDATAFKKLLEESDPWELRRAGLDRALSPHEFGRVLLHLSQRRGALGLLEPEEGEEGKSDDGKVKVALDATRKQLDARKLRSFGELISVLCDERRAPVTTKDVRGQKIGVREWRSAVRNKGGEFQFHADRAMIRDEFDQLWKAQKRLGGETSKILTDDLRIALDDPARVVMDNDASRSKDDRQKYKYTYRAGGLLFKQRFARWDEGTLGRCVLEPTERCAPHADMHASYYRVVETVNSIKITESGSAARSLTLEERQKIMALLRGPLGVHETGKAKGKPKRTVSVTDIRNALGLGRASKTSRVRLNIEADEDRELNTDWFHRTIIHGGLGEAIWSGMDTRKRESVNKAILNFDPDRAEHAAELRAGAMKWWGCTQEQADSLVLGWKSRPALEKRINMSRRAVLNLLSIMDRPWANPEDGQRWVTQIEARKLIAEDGDFKDVSTGEQLHARTRDRYATGAKGLTARDRHYIKKHPDSLPPAPMLTNPVVRKAIHEVRRHIVEHIKKHGRKPDRIIIELAREAKMSAKESDRTLFRNRLRSRIKSDIIEQFNLESHKPSQQRAAVDRVVLCVQQGGVCPICGNQRVKSTITPLMAAKGEDCELAHIVPRGIGGSGGLNNLVVAHTKCNQDMGRKTPRELWRDNFESEISRVERMYADVERVDRKQVDKQSEDKLWACYFEKRDDEAKVANFKKELADIRGFSDRQMSDTRYATRQVLAYLADALFEGKGLPERGGERLIFTTDGGWTGDLRREWGLFQDTHNAKAKGLSNEEVDKRKEKKRGDHRHHALDAVVVALTDGQIRSQWDQRIKAADAKGITAEEFDEFCRQNRIEPPKPFANIDDLRDRVMLAVFGDGSEERPVAHRAVKRKIVGAFHEETLFGPVPGKVGMYKGTKSVLSLSPNHLRMPRPETEKEAVERLTSRRMNEKECTEKDAKKWASAVVRSAGYEPKVVDPPPEKSGLIRDRTLRERIRVCLTERGLNPDDFSANELKKAVEAGAIKQASGIPIKSVVLLRAMNDPVIVPRKLSDHSTGRMEIDKNSASLRAYVGGNNHHIELRVSETGKWTGEVVSTFEASQRKLDFFRALRESRVPRFFELKKLPKGESKRYSSLIAAAEAAHPLVDRSNDITRGGEFVMSLCEGEMVKMLHKETKELGYFVVAKLEKPNRVVLVPHWDARAAGERKDAAGNKVPDSMRDSFMATPDDFKTLTPPDSPYAVKVRVSPLGRVTILEKD